MKRGNGASGARDEEDPGSGGGGAVGKGDAEVRGGITQAGDSQGAWRAGDRRGWMREGSEGVGGCQQM